MKTILSITHILVLIFTSPTLAQEILPGSVGLSKAVHYSYIQGGSGTGNTLIISTTNEGMLFYDVADPDHPELISQVNDEGNYGQLFIYDTYLYPSNSYYVFDIGDPSNPANVGNNPFINRHPTVVTDAGGTEYVVARTTTAELGFYDIQADRISPPLVTTQYLGQTAVLLRGMERRLAYVFYTGGRYDSFMSVQVLDVSDIMDIEFLPLADPIYTGDYGAIASNVYGGAAYVSGSYETHVYNMEDGAYIGELNGGDGVLINDLLITAYLSETRCYRLQDPLNPQLVNSIAWEMDFAFAHPAGGRMIYFCSLGDHAPEGWLDLIDYSTPSQPLIYPGMSYSEASMVVANGQYAATGMEVDGILVDDFSQMLEPFEYLAFNNSEIRDMFLNGPYLYVCHKPQTEYYTELSTVDLSDPSAPHRTDNLECGHVSDGAIAVADGALYLSQDTEIWFFSLADPTHPALVAIHEINPTEGKIAAEGSTLYVINSQTGYVDIYDCSDLANPVFVAEDPALIEAEDNGFKVDNGRIATLGLNSSLNIAYVRLYDITDPNVMQLAYEFPALFRESEGVAFDFEGDLFFLSTTDEVRMYDIRNLDNPLLIASADAPGWGKDLAAVDGYLYLLYDYGLYQYSYDRNTSIVALTLTPVSTVIPAEGGDVVYDAEILSSLTEPVSGQAWVKLTFPNSQVIETFRSPLTVTPGTTMYTGLTQTIPGIAPAGEYRLDAYLGYYPNVVVTTHAFMFNKTALGVDGTPGWEHGEWLAESAAELAQGESGIPTSCTLSEAWPNPFNPSTSLTLSLPDEAVVNVTVYNTQGRNVATLTDGRLSAGTHAVTWTPKDAASGVYFVRATVNNQPLQTRKLVYMR